MRRKPRPPTPDRRQPWQIEQGNACGCKGTDDMCPCQNERPWPRPRRDLEGEIRTLELQQKTDRESIAILFARAETAEARVKALEEALVKIAERARRSAAGQYHGTWLDGLKEIEGLVTQATLQPQDGKADA